MACKPDREGAPNPRVQLTVAMRFGEREVGGECRAIVAVGRPQLTRHPLGGTNQERFRSRTEQA